MKQPTPVYVSFYANRKRLGGAYIKEASDQEDRDIAARKRGINKYNYVIFENRRPKLIIYRQKGKVIDYFLFHKSYMNQIKAMGKTIGLITPKTK
jgi:hypothetical protein